MRISIVIPSYNEESNIPEMIRQLDAVLAGMGELEIIFIDDGSTDNTLNVLDGIRAKDNRIHYISLSRNFGHQNALKCGLDFATGDCIISLDADLQHPVELIPALIAKWRDGFKVVYTKRKADKSLPFLKRATSRFFYKIMNSLSDVQIEDGAADFRLLDREVNNVFKTLREGDLFIRGLVKWLGYSQYCIEYQPKARFSGTTKYSVKKMIQFAIRGITSFSIRPIRISILVGSVISFAAFLYGLYALYIGLFTSKAISGWSSVIISVLFIGGLQLVLLGVIGEYIGKIFLQTKSRPTYVVSKKTL